MGALPNGRYSDLSEWQRSIKSRESVSPKILSGTATGVLIPSGTLRHLPFKKGRLWKNCDKRIFGGRL